MYAKSQPKVVRLALAALLVALQGVAGFPEDHVLFQRDYQDTVCEPATSSPTDTVPPCVEIQTIQQVCNPNGTAPLDLEAHAQCMCGGSFFAEWPYCLQCLYVHGLRSQRDVAFYQSVISSASQELCGTATPTADFQVIFSGIQATLSQPTTGSTVSSDQFPSQTAVSLYYTASGSQGPGKITGSATGATATGTTALASGSGSGGSASAGGAAKTTSGGVATGSASSSSASASPSSAASSETVSRGGIVLAALFGMVLVL